MTVSCFTVSCLIALFLALTGGATVGTGEGLVVTSVSVTMDLRVLLKAFLPLSSIADLSMALSLD
jgi:hypothetical protein